MAQILLIEDDSNFALGLRTVLSREGHIVESVCDGEAAIERAQQRHFDLILLDINLPKKDGYAVCDELRRDGNTTPILMLTLNASDPQRVYGFQVGADDYVVKPFNRFELLVRIKAVLRRVGPENFVANYRFGDIEVDFRKAEVHKNGRSITLTPLDYKLLFTFIRNRDRILTREQLLNQVCGLESDTTDRVIDNHVMSLRRKIEPNPKRPIYLVTRGGLGYLFNAQTRI